MKQFRTAVCITSMIMIFLPVISVSGVLYAQPAPSFSDEMSDAGKTFSGLWNETFSPGKTGIQNYLIYTAATTGAFFLDEQVRIFAKANQSELADILFSTDAFYGEGYTYIPLLALYGYGIAAGNRDIRNLGLKLTTASFFALFYNMSLKSLIGRSRPFLNEGNASFDPLSFAFENTSFPSGHTTFTFAIAAVVDQETNSVPLEALFYTAAVWTAMARIYHDVHWFSDTVAGAAIGYFAARWAAQELDRLQNNRQLRDSPPAPIIHITIPL